MNHSEAARIHGAVTVAMRKDLVPKLEHHFFSSAPSLVSTSHSSGWLIRASSGYTKRGNSASSLGGTAPLDHKTLEEISGQLRKPTVIRITPLANPRDDAFLEELGWRYLDPSVVMTYDLGRLVVSPGVSETGMIATASPSSAWIDGFSASSALSPAHTETFRSTMSLIAPPFYPTYLTLTNNETARAVAYGQSVRSGDLVGLYNIVIPPGHRGKGYGRTITRALLDHAANAGATLAYLQVTEANTLGKGMYERMGFEEAYGYHYRTAP